MNKGTRKFIYGLIIFFIGVLTCIICVLIIEKNNWISLVFNATGAIIAGKGLGIMRETT